MIADNNSYLVTITNSSNIDTGLITIGKNSVGTVFKGQVVTYKYFEEQDKAVVSIPGFKPYSTLLKGEIDLKAGYIYNIELYYNSTIKEYRYNITGIYYSDSEKFIILK